MFPFRFCSTVHFFQQLYMSGWSRFGSVRTGSAVFSAIPIQVLPVRRFGRFTGSAGSPVQPVLKKVVFTKRCAPRFHAECTGHCVESFHEEPIREKNVIFKKVASWYPGIPVRGSASSLFSRFAGSHPFSGSPIRFGSVRFLSSACMLGCQDTRMPLF